MPWRAGARKGNKIKKKNKKKKRERERRRRKRKKRKERIEGRGKGREKKGHRIGKGGKTLHFLETGLLPILKAQIIYREIDIRKCSEDH